MQQHSSKCSARRHPSRTLGWGQKLEIQFFSENGHVAYLIKGDGNRSNVVANKDGVKRSKFNFFLVMIILAYIFLTVLFYTYLSVIIFLTIHLFCFGCFFFASLFPCNRAKLVNVIVVVYSKSKEDHNQVPRLT